MATQTKTKTYETNADNNRTYQTTRKRDALSVHRAWEKQGIRPHTYTVTEDADGRPVCDRIA